MSPMKQFGATDFSQLFSAVQDLAGMGDRNVTRLSRPEADQLDCGEFLRLNRQLTDKIASQNQILKQICSRWRCPKYLKNKHKKPKWLIAFFDHTIMRDFKFHTEASHRSSNLTETLQVSQENGKV